MKEIADEDVVMPCGIHKGKRLDDLPTSYLIWVAGNWSEKDAASREICLAADRLVQERFNAR